MHSRSRRTALFRLQKHFAIFQVAVEALMAALKFSGQKFMISGLKRCLRMQPTGADTKVGLPPN